MHRQQVPEHLAGSGTDGKAAAEQAGRNRADPEKVALHQGVASLGQQAGHVSLSTAHIGRTGRIVPARVADP